MSGMNPKIFSHWLNVQPNFHYVQQNQWWFAPFKNQIIYEELNKLLAAGFIWKVKYPTWLANMVIVLKKNEKWLICVDYTDLNNACPKVSYTLSRIDQLVDSIFDYEVLSFLDVYSGYKKILMHSNDRKNGLHHRTWDLLL